MGLCIDRCITTNKKFPFKCGLQEVEEEVLYYYLTAKGKWTDFLLTLKLGLKLDKNIAFNYNYIIIIRTYADSIVQKQF